MTHETHHVTNADLIAAKQVIEYATPLDGEGLNLEGRAVAFFGRAFIQKVGARHVEYKRAGQQPPSEYDIAMIADVYDRAFELAVAAYESLVGSKDDGLLYSWWRSEGDVRAAYRVVLADRLTDTHFSAKFPGQRDAEDAIRWLDRWLSAEDAAHAQSPVD